MSVDWAAVGNIQRLKKIGAWGVFDFNFFKIDFMALEKPPFFFASLAEWMPGLLFKALIHKPESSEITGKSTNFEKKLTLSLEFDINVFPVSLGLFIFKVRGDIFLYFFEIK